jgi:hypothetical protein
MEKKHKRELRLLATGSLGLKNWDISPPVLRLSATNLPGLKEIKEKISHNLMLSFIMVKFLLILFENTKLVDIVEVRNSYSNNDDDVKDIILFQNKLNI